MREALGKSLCLKSPLNKPPGNEHFITKQMNKVKRNDQANFEANITVVSSELNDRNRKFNRKIKMCRLIGRFGQA
jgi:hypothetical protein